MNSTEFQQKLDRYAELTLRVGLNLQPGQRLLITEMYGNDGIPLHTAPLVRRIVEHAYKLGARYVDVIWNDEEFHLARFKYAPRNSFSEFPTWHANAVVEHLRRGDALLTITATDPDLLKDADPELVSAVQRIRFQNYHPARQITATNAVNWCVIAAPASAWAAKVFPVLPAEEQEAQLWNLLFQVCRLNQTDPITAWQQHIRDLVARANYLNQKQYAALRYAAPGTDLTIGLPSGHIWRSAGFPSQTGIPFVANLPTEEVFTLPHKDRTEGVVRAALPLSHAGTLIENFSLEFSNGRVVKVSAEKGETVLRKLLETDEGAARLGEAALVPHSSPISQSGVLFYNTLFDENAASHIALGRAYKFSLEGGAAMSDEEFAARGGNNSLTHVDFMIGSGEMDIDGITESGAAEPVMRGGEWAFAA